MPASSFPPEEISSGFDNNARNLRVSLLLTEQYLAAADALAVQATEDLDVLLACGTPMDEETCVQEFIERFAERAYRRPATSEQQTRLFEVFKKARTDFDLRGSVEQVIAVVLQAPHFLYRIEPDLAQGVRDLDSYELASRISYLVWGSQPDEVLMDAARTGALATPEQVRAQAERMMEDPRFVNVLDHFHDQWLGLSELTHVEKDLSLFPEWNEELKAHLAEETRRFAAETVSSGGTLTDLLTAPVTYLNGPLAQYYGVAGPIGESFERVDLDPTRHAGLLTHGSLMAMHAKAARSEPIFRGVFVRSAIMCDPPLPPPPGVVADVNVDPNLTGRERLEAHRADPACANCHALFDPIGFGFENFDAGGRYRELENGVPVDASGTLTGTDVDGSFFGPVELAQKLAESSMPNACLVGKWFTYGYGRTVVADDSCNVEQLEELLTTSGGSIQALILELTQTEAFLKRGASLPVEGEL
jgi:hypothetical protein